MKAQVTRLLLGRKEKTTAKGNRKLKQSQEKPTGQALCGGSVGKTSNLTS